MDSTDTVLKSKGRKQKSSTQPLNQKELDDFVLSFLNRGEEFIAAVAENGSPLYVVEKPVLRKRVAQFQAAFRSALPDFKIFYAVKSNNHPDLCKLLVQSGVGLDVSSGAELESAISHGASEVVFSGPGKTDAELNLAAKHREKVMVLIDSFSELERLDRAAARAGRVVRAGVRLTTDEKGLWRKFGIPLADLPKFYAHAESFRHVSLKGLQFHSSWNMNPRAQVDFIARIGSMLAGLGTEQRAKVTFLDIGGGFWPAQGEWLLRESSPRAGAQTPADTAFDPLRHYVNPSLPIEQFATEIGTAIKTHIFPHVQCRILAEPGRWLCNDAVHLLLTVVDKKSDDLVITDGGTNVIGWERFETDYFPVINLSKPELVEKPCYVLGSLCTPHDVWGFAYFGESIDPGDVLMIPTQGAYTYSLRQQFIKPLPKLVLLGAKKNIADWDVDE